MTYVPNKWITYVLTTINGATYTYESHFIQKIVNEISNAKLNQTLLHVAEYPIEKNSRV